METFSEEIVDNFLQPNSCNRNHTRLCQHVEKPDSLGVKCIRKKYKCIILWLLSIVVITQLFIIIFEKLDDKLLNQLLIILSKKLKKSNNTNTPQLFNAPSNASY